MNHRKEAETSQHLTRRQRRAQQRALSKEESVPNPQRRWLVIGGVSTLVAAALGIGIYQSKGGNRSVVDSDIEAKIKEYLSQEQEMEPLVVAFEKGFGQFSQRVVELISHPDTSPESRIILRKPLDVFKINLDNPYRNIHFWKRQDLEINRSFQTREEQLGNPNFYFYDFKEIEAGSIAGFVPATRTMELSRAYDPNNILDNLIAMHELVHVAQDTLDRSSLPQNTYNAFQHRPANSKPRIVGIYEATAFIEEIYTLNLFTGGQFRSDVLSNGGTIDVNKYVAILNARPNQARTIDFLSRMAFQFYNSRSSVEGIDVRFLDYINRIHRAQGVDVFDRTPNGFALLP